MQLRFHAYIEKGDNYLVASCAEIPEAVGQGRTREECLQDLRDSIRSVLEYRQSEALARVGPNVEQVELEVA